jgi:hypothetical protein
MQVSENPSKRQLVVYIPGPLRIDYPYIWDLRE